MILRDVRDDKRRLTAIGSEVVRLGSPTRHVRTSEVVRAADQTSIRGTCVLRIEEVALER